MKQLIRFSAAVLVCLALAHCTGGDPDTTGQGGGSGQQVGSGGLSGISSITTAHPFSISPAWRERALLRRA